MGCEQLSPAGNTLNFSTFPGGSGRDEAEGIALDPQGYLYVSGATTSDDFPVDDPVQATRGGGTDGFAARYFPGVVADDEGTTAAFETAYQNTNPAYVPGGHYTPNNPLSVFDRQSSAGVWSLNVSDRLGGDSGVTRWQAALHQGRH